MRKVVVLLLVGVAGCSGGAEKTETPVAAIELQPGEWEMTVQISDMKLNGASQPEMKAGKSTTFKNCITPDQIKKPDAGLFANAPNCSYNNFYQSDGRINASISCKDAKGSNLTNSMIDGKYTATTMTIETQMQSSVPNGGKIEMAAKMDGKRIGECPAAPAVPAKS